MPRVLKEVPIKEKEVVCSDCGRTIAYVKNDISEYNGTDYGGGPSGFQYIICPGTGCNKRIVLRSW